MVIGVIVDNINKVIGISSETIQPPPPLFGDINIKYISGVVDYADKLYIILDVDMIFEDDKKEELSKKEQLQIISKADKRKKKKKDEKSLEFDFISQTLKAFKHYFVTPLNEEWVSDRIDDWASMCKKQGRDIQLSGTEDADTFLYSFYSPCTGLLWDENYNNAVTELLPDSKKGTIGIWNPGCGKGLETYSIACCMKMKYPDAHLKIWANDNSLIDISTAPNMLLMEHDIPDYFKQGNFLVKTDQGYKFSKELTDAIYFEYHDIISDNSIPQVDFIIIRDVLSFFSPENQQKLLKEFEQLLKDDGILFTGMNERILDKGWKSIGNKTIPAYTKVTE